MKEYIVGKIIVMTLLLIAWAALFVYDIYNRHKKQ